MIHANIISSSTTSDQSITEEKSFPAQSKHKQPSLLKNVFSHVLQIVFVITITCIYHKFIYKLI